MIKTFTFSTTNNKNNNTFQFTGNTNYSKIIDAGITADLIKKNSYLFKNFKKNEDANIFMTNLGYKPTSYIDDDFTKALKFIANYKKYKKTYTLPYILGKMYTLSDGTPIVFYDDEVQIGFDSYSYSDFYKPSFLNNLNANTKKIIINIYTNGIKDININLL